MRLGNIRQDKNPEVQIQTTLFIPVGQLSLKLQAHKRQDKTTTTSQHRAAATRMNGPIRTIIPANKYMKIYLKVLTVHQGRTYFCSPSFKIKTECV